MRELLELQKRIKEKPYLVRQYIQNGSKDQNQLNLISEAIINVYNGEGQVNDKHALEECHAMALSASKNMVEKLFFKIVPELVQSRKQGSLLPGYLKAWTVMFPGKWKYSQYPNFEAKYGKMVSQQPLPGYLKSSFNQYQTNLKTSNETVQFFEDSLSSEYSTQRQDIKQVPHSIDPSELETIKTHLSQNSGDLARWINSLHQLRHTYLNTPNLDSNSQLHIARNLPWMNQFVSKFQEVKSQPHFQTILINYYKELQLTGYSSEKPSNWNFDSVKINSERAINLPRKQQDFNEFRRVINSNSPGQSRFSSIEVDKQTPINSVFQNQMYATGRQQPLVLKKHVPSHNQSPGLKRSRNKIFDDGNSSYLGQGHHRNFNKTKDFQKSIMSKSIKLSQFSSEKNIRKKTVNFEELDSTPEWLLRPYLTLFDSYKLFSRYRKNSLLRYSTILEDQTMIVHCTKKRVSSVAMEFTINYQNYSPRPIHLNVCYKIAHETFSVGTTKKIRSNMVLEKNDSHQFTLQIKQLPLKICALQLSYNDISIEIPLPFSIINYVGSEPISKEQFFLSWNTSNRTSNYSLSTKIHYDPRILIPQQIHQLFQHSVYLDRTQNYSFQQYGVKLNFQYYNLEFLLIFAFNIDSYLTLEMVSCQQVEEERAEVLNHYMKVLIMLLENMG